MPVFRIDACPRQPRIRAAINTAADLAYLVCITDKYFISITRVDENAGEITIREIATANLPRLASIMRYEERGLRSGIHVIRSLRILGYRVDRHVMRYTVELAPGLSRIKRHENAGGGRTHQDRFRLSWIRRDASGPRIVAAVRELFPTLRRIDAAIQSGVGSR